MQVSSKQPGDWLTCHCASSFHTWLCCCMYAHTAESQLSLDLSQTSHTGSLSVLLHGPESLVLPSSSNLDAAAQSVWLQEALCCWISKKPCLMLNNWNNNKAEPASSCGASTTLAKNVLLPLTLHALNKSQLKLKDYSGVKICYAACTASVTCCLLPDTTKQSVFIYNVAQVILLHCIQYRLQARGYVLDFSRGAHVLLIKKI